MLRCVVISRQKADLEILQLCCSLIPSLHLEACFSEPFEALSLVGSGAIDLVFLNFDRNCIHCSDLLRFVHLSTSVIIISDEKIKSVQTGQQEIASLFMKRLTLTSFLEAINLVINRS